MSVNYYWKMSIEPATWTNPLGESKTMVPDENDPLIHVCQWAAGRYSWAQQPESVLSYCNMHPSNVVIVAEHGVEYTGSEFYEMVKGKLWETNLIGKWFC